MIGKVLLSIGAALPFLWGIAHLFPTKSVVRDFGDISEDNRNIIRMEWMIEGVALIFIGVLVAGIDPRSAAAWTALIASSSCIIVLAALSLFTGFRIAFQPFRLCPAIFTASALLITVGWILL